ncbi:FimV/HubP family polar landmark protein [Paraburkholderia kururiensis]|uniref:FimV/HubP family polar landmark protein n=1 Tax=Paraburkholderia kururiensis TaxID=984307 RepID=UPI001F188A58|nr:FimV/HubP family polar landmark protein [Paraburkholderia kururiensis]
MRSLAAAIAVAFLAPGLSQAAPAATAGASGAANAAASAPSAANVASAAGAGTASQYTVRPGQSLNDVAIDVTQSHDRATLARATRALFDANPGAFMGHDSNRLKLGAVLNVPTLDATGAPAASGVAASAAPAASAATAAAASAAAASPSASHAQEQAPNALPHATMAGTAASASAAAATASAAAATGGSAAAASANTAAAGASVPATTSASPSASSTPATSAAATPSQAVPAATASGTHVWSGAIQPPASEPAGAAPASTPSASSATPAQPATSAAAQPASQPRVPLSSLQQLLALKNRVLMELQKHGIGAGKSAAPSTGAAASGATAQAPVGGASQGAAKAPSSSAPAISAPATGSRAGGGQFQLPPVEPAVAAGLGAAVVALIVGFAVTRRKRKASTAGAAEGAPSTSASAQDTPQPHDGDRARARQTAATGAGLLAADAAAHMARQNEEAAAAARDDIVPELVPTLMPGGASSDSALSSASEHGDHAESRDTHDEDVTAHPHEAAFDPAASQEPAAGPEAQGTGPDGPETFDHVTGAASLAAAAELGADALPPTHFEPVGTPEHAPYEPEGESGPAAQSHAFEPETADDATRAASLAAAAELGAEALPLRDLEPRHGATDGLPPFAQPEDASLIQTESQQDQSAAAELHEEPSAARAEGIPAASVEPEAPTQTTHPTSEFPHEAVAALGSLDMPLPPRVEQPSVGEPAAAPFVPPPVSRPIAYAGLAEALTRGANAGAMPAAEPSAPAGAAPESLSLQPVASPEATAQQAVPEAVSAPATVASEIAAGTAGAAAVAGLGAARFGALKLDFDLELPPSPAQPLPAFTPEQLAKIARNKLELASEYIQLGDLSGARTLINEVIESNDAGTRDEARALLSTLAPLS